MMRSLPKPPLVRPRASDLATQPEAAPPAIDVTALGRKREIGDLRVPREIARVIDEALPEVLQLDEDCIALCALPIQFHRIVKGMRYVALLYVGEGYEELTYLSWFLSSVCLRIFITTTELRLHKPAIEIIAARYGLLPEDWSDELDACLAAGIIKSKRITRIQTWLGAGPEGALPHVKVWTRQLELSGDDSQNERGDSFGQTARPCSDDKRATAASQAALEQASSRKVPLVFISYSHEDQELFRKLMTSLSPLNDAFKTKAVWTDEDIKASEYFRNSIDQAMASARVVVALVTNSFLASDFIKKVELKKALEARMKDEKGLAWILGGACAAEQYGLKEIQAACSLKKPLNQLTPGEQDEQLENVRKRVEELLILAGELKP
jgi:hypothetical protein